MEVHHERARAAFIQVYPLCLICFLEGVITPVDEVDHIIPLDDNSDLEHLTHPKADWQGCASRTT